MSTPKELSIDHGPLGEKSAYPERYSPSVLHPIPRALGREALGIGNVLPFAGEDLWNAWEVSWLDAYGKPMVALLELRVPCTSPNIVESKSLKLYLGSFNQERFASAAEVEQRISQDLTRLVGAPVLATLEFLHHARGSRFAVSAGSSCSLSDVEGRHQARGSRFAVSAPLGECIDDTPLYEPSFAVSSQLLQCEMGEVREETLHSHLLRSNCPVTGQPDWATLIVRYRGQPIQRQALLSYIVSYRNHNDFHEQCVERIFMDLMQRCQPERLFVYARYTRRGGIDINPVRSNDEALEVNNLRLLRQ
ncbi:7-cyano-7-deazaguanine reductase [gamma proteobacterium HdN1]|nr:7-cyano-7-deazaguanine reductase [gamma proteobacterium HdN1]